MRDKQTLLIFLWLLSPLFVLATDYYVATSGLNVRSGAGKQYSIVFTLEEGDQVEVLSKSGNWYKIKYLRIVGYANSNYLKSTSNSNHTNDIYFPAFLLIVGFIAIWLFKRWLFEISRKQRRDYYRTEYLASDEWQRKRFVVLKRDNWRCVNCGAHATQVHHKRYARTIGKEPIHWLVSICKPCHDSFHQ